MSTPTIVPENIITTAQQQARLVQDVSHKVLMLLEEQDITIGMAKTILNKAINTLDSIKMQAVPPSVDPYIRFMK